MRIREKAHFHDKWQSWRGGVFGRMREAVYRVAEWIYSANMFVIKWFMFCDEDDVEGNGPIWYAAMSVFGWMVAFSAVWITLVCAALVIYAFFAFYEFAIPAAVVFILFWIVKLIHLSSGRRRDG